MERVSEFMDGELNVDSAERQIARLKSDAAARDAWHTYHLIGDVMRGADVAGAAVPGMKDFSARFAEKLAAEPTVLAPHPRRDRPRTLQTYALSAAASVAAVAVVGWMGLSVMKADAPGQNQLAQAPAVATAAQGPAATIAPVQAPAVPAPVATAPEASSPARHMHEYMLAHSGISPLTQIQGVTTYIRTVSASDD